MQQHPMTIITEILPGKKSELEKDLAPIGQSIKHHSLIQFSEYQQLHYCSIFVIPGGHSSSAGANNADLLVFEANIDGGAKEFLQELIAKNRDFVNTMYRCCRGYPGEHPERLVDYLLEHDCGANAFYVAHPGQSRRVICEQQQLRQRIEAHLDVHHTQLRAKQPSQIHAELKQLANGSKPEVQPLFNRKGDRIFKVLVVAVVILLAGGIVGAFGPLVMALLIMTIVAYVVVLRHKEKHDRQDDTPWVNSEQMQAIREVEDRQLQNHLISVTEIKPGWFRLTTLRLVLAIIHLFAKLVATKGDLSGIVTIHFARWVILPDNKRLLFLSNYDGSWEHYLGEFIDHASLGLTAVWSNTRLGEQRGFPNTEWLAWRGGSRDEQRFKDYARNSQIAELIWYSAYVDLSVKNIANNRSIHEGIFSSSDLSAWLNRL